MLASITCALLLLVAAVLLREAYTKDEQDKEKLMEAKLYNSNWYVLRLAMPFDRFLWHHSSALTAITTENQPSCKALVCATAGGSVLVPVPGILLWCWMSTMHLLLLLCSSLTRCCYNMCLLLPLTVA